MVVDKSNIQVFLTCRECVTSLRQPRIIVGLVSPTTLRIWCKTCDDKVGDFELADEIMPKCDICGESGEHKH
jgi:hypothetical protein